MESCLIHTSNAGKTVCVVIDWISNLRTISSITFGSLSDLKRVIYEVFCHVIRGDLKHDDVISFLSDVTVRNALVIGFPEGGDPGLIWGLC